MTNDEVGFEPLFNGTDLTGWTRKPRIYDTLYPGGPKVWEEFPFPADYNDHARDLAALWTVEDGVIVGRQNTPPAFGGGYLVTDRSFRDFELRLEAKPDWGTDTGIMLRRRFDSWEGLQVLVDHRRSGNIGGFFGNGIGHFHAIPFAFTAITDSAGNPTGLTLEDPADSIEPFTLDKAEMLEYGVSPEEFLDAWRWDEWNEISVTSVGSLPKATTFINGVKIATIDLAALVAPNYDATAVEAALGGHIALEVHDTDPMLGDERWIPGAACRYRNIRIREV
jgi:hypothetical protein